MVDRASGYFGLPFKGYLVLTKGDLLSPTLFNVVMDVVIHHWVTVVEQTEEGMEGLLLSIQDLEAYFYFGNVLTSSTQLERLQRAFNILTGLFDRAGLRKNTRNMVIMDFQPFCAPGRM